MKKVIRWIFGLLASSAVSSSLLATLVSSPRFTAINLPTSVALGATINVSATAVANYSDNSDGNSWNDPDQVVILRIKIDYAPPGGAWTNLTDSLPEFVSPNSVSSSVTANVSGTWSFRFQTMDGRPWYGPSSSTFYVYSVTVNPPPGPVINSSLSMDVKQGQEVNFQITATGNPTHFTASPLPDGLTLNASTGVISGVLPTNDGILGNDAIISTNLGASNVSGSDHKTLVWNFTAATIAGSITASPAVLAPGQSSVLSYSASANFDVNWVEHTYWRPNGTPFVPGLTTGDSGSRSWIPDAGPGTYYYTMRVVDKKINYRDIPAISFSVAGNGLSTFISNTPVSPYFGQTINFSVNGSTSSANLTRIAIEYQRPTDLASQTWNAWNTWTFANTGSYSATATLVADAVGGWGARSKAFDSNSVDSGWQPISVTVQKAVPEGTFVSRSFSAAGGDYTVTDADLNAAFNNPYGGSVAGPSGVISYQYTSSRAVVVAGTRLPVGSNSIDAIFAGDANYQPKTTTAVFTVNAVDSLADSDGNGMADGWEMAYFGRIGVDPMGDADGDGVTNLTEFIQGTDPTNSDVSEPSVPSGLQTNSFDERSAVIAWNPSTDTAHPAVGKTGIAGYILYRDGVRLSLSLLTGLSYTDSELRAGSTYNYTIKSVDLAGNISAQSTPLVVTTLGGATEMALTVSDAASNHATLSWTVPGSIASFTVAVERATSSGNFAQVFQGANVFNFTDYGLTAGETYSFRIKVTPVNGSPNYSASVGAFPSATSGRDGAVDSAVDLSSDSFSYTPILLLPDLQPATDSSLLVPAKITPSGKVLLILRPTSLFGAGIKYEDYYLTETYRGLRWVNGTFEPLKHSPAWQNWQEFTVDNSDADPFWVRRSSESSIYDMNDAGEVVGVINTHVSPMTDHGEVYHQFFQPSVWLAGSNDARELRMADQNTSEVKLPAQDRYLDSYDVYQNTPLNTAEFIDDGGRIFGLHRDSRSVPGTTVPQSFLMVHQGIQYWTSSASPSSYLLNEYLISLSPDGQHRLINSDHVLLDDVAMSNPASGPINNSGRYLSGFSWSEHDRALQMLPGLTGTALAINSSQTILGQNAGYNYGLWTWENATGQNPPFPSGTYHQHTLDFHLPTGMDTVRLADSMSDSRVLLGTVHRAMDFNGVPVPDNRATVPALFVRAAIAVDANRDGQISLTGPLDATDEKHPFRFWVNDDDDAGGDEVSGDDIPHGYDYLTNDITGEGLVRGTRDLTDLFPIYLDLRQLLTILPPSAEVKYRLKQADSALNFVYTNLTREHAFEYQRPEAGTAPLGTGFGVNLDQAPQRASKFRVTAAGFDLFRGTFGGSRAFLDAIQNHSGGVILVEGRTATNKPLVLSVEKSDGTVIAEVKLELKISPVETMFRHLNLHDRNLPGLIGTMSGGKAQPEAMGDPAGFPDDPNSNSRWLIFVHGFNVSGLESRGWNAEMFKRCYWSGNKSRFVGVSWFGNPDQVFGAISDYQLSVRNALATAPTLAREVNSLPGGADSKAIFAHSLGCGVISSAVVDHGLAVGRVCFVDAALPSESLDGRDPNAFTLENDGMTPAVWKPYSTKLYAANWFARFDAATDERGNLTWNNRFSTMSSTLFNFYSSTEDVLAEYTGELPPTLGGVISVPGHLGTFGWVYQEKGKGNRQNYGLLATEFTHLGSYYGGWGMNRKDPVSVSDVVYWKWVISESFVGRVIKTQGEIGTVSDSVLRRHPVFEPGWGVDRNQKEQENPVSNVSPVEGAPTWIYDLYSSTAGNVLAGDLTNRGQLLAEAIPSLTWCMGSHTSIRLQDGRNYNLPLLVNPINWPRGKRDSITPEWRHSDIREVAYLYQYRVFDQIVLISTP